MKKFITAFLMLIIAQFSFADDVIVSCVGGETGYFLSHANGQVFLQKGNQGLGEGFRLVYYGNNKYVLECLGKEKGYYLSHANGKVWLQKGVQGDGELWQIYKKDGLVTIMALGGETGLYLSHANGKVFLQNGVQGYGERWR